MIAIIPICMAVFTGWAINPAANYAFSFLCGTTILTTLALFLSKMGFQPFQGNNIFSYLLLAAFGVFRWYLHRKKTPRIPPSQTLPSKIKKIFKNPVAALVAIIFLRQILTSTLWPIAGYDAISRYLQWANYLFHQGILPMDTYGPLQHTPGLSFWFCFSWIWGDASGLGWWVGLIIAFWQLVSKYGFGLLGFLVLLIPELQRNVFIQYGFFPSTVYLFAVYFILKESKNDFNAIVMASIFGLGSILHRLDSVYFLIGLWGWWFFDNRGISFARRVYSGFGLLLTLIFILWWKSQFLLPDQAAGFNGIVSGIGMLPQLTKILLSPTVYLLPLILCMILMFLPSKDREKTTVHLWILGGAVVLFLHVCWMMPSPESLWAVLDGAWKRNLLFPVMLFLWVKIDRKLTV